MTLHEVTNQIYNLSVHGCINGEKFTEQRFYKLVKSIMSANNIYIFQIALQDGLWYASINKYANRSDGYDYFIPNNREQEKILIDPIFHII